MRRVWINGRLLDAAQAAVGVDDRGFLLADGLFETIRVARGAPLRLARHLARLQEGADLLELALPSSERLEAALRTTIAANRLREGSARLTATRGAGKRGIDIPRNPRALIVIATSRHAPATGAVRVTVEPRYRRDGRSPLSAIKALGYLPAVLARQAARRRGADDALLLNPSGRLASATAATLLLWRRDRWITPPCAEGALPGTARAVLLEAGFLAERQISRRALAASHAALLVNALGARAVLAVDGRPMTWPAPVLRQLASIAQLLELPGPPHPRLAGRRSAFSS